MRTLPHQANQTGDQEQADWDGHHVIPQRFGPIPRQYLSHTARAACRRRWQTRQSFKERRRNSGVVNPEHVPRNVHRETSNRRGAQRRVKQSKSTKLTYHIAAQPQATERLFRTLERVDYPWEPAERKTDKDQDDEDD